MKNILNNQPIKIITNTVTLEGNLTIPESAKAIVVFAHGSGSSRFSPRNNQVAQALNQDGMATLLFDLLTPDEESVDEYTREFRFNIQLLADRLISVTDWLQEQSHTKHLNMGYFGASTGAAATLVAAAHRANSVKAVVSRGGRPDLAGDALPKVKAPTLLIVGGHDEVVIDLNQLAMKQLRCETQLKIIEGATHLFEEAGALDEVIVEARKWFKKFL